MFAEIRSGEKHRLRGMLFFWFLLGAFLLIVSLYAVQVLRAEDDERAFVPPSADDDRLEREPQDP